MIVVTGGAGFIGSNLVAALNARGETEIVVCDRLRDGPKWRNIAKREIAGFVPPEELFTLLNDHRTRVKAIFHMGASSSTTETDADRIAKDNLRYTLAVWNWCAQANARMIYASSAATYGDGAHGFDDDQSIDHLAKLAPMNAYAWSKQAFDRRAVRIAERGDGHGSWARAAAFGDIPVESQKPRQWVGFKFFNVYGPNEFHKAGQRSVALQLWKQIRDTGRARLFKSARDDVSDHDIRRDFVWVGDCVDAMLWAYDNPRVNGLFNSGSGAGRSFDDLARAVFKAMNREPAIDYVDMPDSLRAGYQYFTQANMAKIRKAGFNAAATALDDGVRRYVQDHLEQPDPYL